MAKIIVKNVSIKKMKDDPKTAYATWAFSRANTDNYVVVWSYLTRDGVWFKDSESTEDNKQSTYTIPDTAVKVGVNIKPVAKKHKKKGEMVAWWTGSFCGRTKLPVSETAIDPEVPSAPSYTFDGNRIELTNTTTDANTDKIEYQFVNATTRAIIETFSIKVINGIAKTKRTLDQSVKIRIRARGVKLNAKKTARLAVSDWSDYTDILTSLPGATTITSVTPTTDDGVVSLIWDAVDNATGYEIQYTNRAEYFANTRYDVISGIGSISFEAVTSGYISGLSLGETWYLRIRAKNDVGNGLWSSEYYTIALGLKPNPPTTWSNEVNVKKGDPINFYWTHNSVDGSKAKTSRFHYIYSVDTEENEVTVDLENEKFDDPEWDGILTYQLDTSEFDDGTVIKWDVMTWGVDENKPSDYSIQRTVKVHAEPVLELGIDEVITSYPINISLTTSPSRQRPIEFRIVVTTNEAYETEDYLGNSKWVNIDDTIFNRTFTPIDDEQSVYALMPNDINLDNGISYNIKVSVATDAGLTKEVETSFTVEWSDDEVEIDAELAYDPVSYTMGISPYVNAELSEEQSLDELLRPGGATTMTYRRIDEVDGVLVKSAISSSYKKTILYDSAINVVGCARIAIDIKRTDRTVSIAEYYDSTHGRVTEYGSSEAIDHELNSSAKYIYLFFGKNDGTDIMMGTDIMYENDASITFTTDTSDDYELAVYRIDYNGDMVLIQNGLDNSRSYTVIDPHPNLNYASYRIVAISTRTGATDFLDVTSEPIDEPSIIIQWDESWSNMIPNPDNPDELADPEWTGSMVKLPYDIDTSESNDVEVSLVKYVGRQNPVSYYGTQRGTMASWKTTVLKDDIETIYALRKLSVWPGNAYVREPSGIGYLANVKITMDFTHCDPKVPVNLEITRVD